MARGKDTMTVDEFRLEQGKSRDESANAQTRRLFLFHIRARRLPTPLSKDHPDGELVFMQGEIVARHTKRKKLTSRSRAPEWKFDFAWPDHKIAVEIEGVSVVRAGKMFLIGGRHGTIDGFKEDCEKYAWATVNGWRLLRFEQSQVKAGLAIDMLVRLFAANEVEDVQRPVARLAFEREEFGHDARTIADLRPETDELQFGRERVER